MAVEILKILIEYGADINHNSTEDGIPLYLAVQAENVEIVKILVDAGCELNL